MHPAYHIVRDTYTDWTGHALAAFAPNERQAVVVEAVRAALAAGNYYSSDVRAFCAARIEIDEAAGLVLATKVEGGAFGMDCYYARRYLDACKEREANREAANTLHAGQKFKRLRATSWTVTSAVLDSFTHTGEECRLTGKRGASRVQFTCSATALLTMAERATERAALLAERRAR